MMLTNGRKTQRQLKVAIQYYQKLFSTSQAEVHEELLEAIVARVSDPMNALLTREFQAEEVKKALK